MDSYESHHAKMREKVEQRIAGEIPDTWIFAEHLPVITRGRGLQRASHLQAQRHEDVRQMELPTDLEFPVLSVERGGDLTYHGPGQLILYPILKLDGLGRLPARDLGACLRGLEASVIQLASELGVKAKGIADASGVWVETPNGPRKIASLGIAVRKWVTYHGIALNLSTDLSAFQKFSPCGYDGGVMANLFDLMPDDSPHAQTWRTPRPWSEVRRDVEASWRAILMSSSQFQGSVAR